MSASEIHRVVTAAPIPQALNDPKWRYKFDYEMWKRTGGETSSIPNLKDLKASVGELNMMTGINIGKTVQQQLDGKVDIPASSVITELGQSLDVNVTPIGNVGIGEDTLISYTMPADTLSADKEYLEITAWGIFASNLNNKRVKLKLGSTFLFDSGIHAINGGSWKITATVVRVSSTVLQAIADITADGSLLISASTYTDITEDTATELDIFCTGEAVSTDDIVQKGQIIKWFNI